MVRSERSATIITHLMNTLIKLEQPNKIRKLCLCSHAGPLSVCERKRANDWPGSEGVLSSTNPSFGRSEPANRRTGKEDTNTKSNE